VPLFYPSNASNRDWCLRSACLSSKAPFQGDGDQQAFDAGGSDHLSQTTYVAFWHFSYMVAGGCPLSEARLERTSKDDPRGGGWKLLRVSTDRETLCGAMRLFRVGFHKTRYLSAGCQLPRLPIRHEFLLPRNVLGGVNGNLWTVGSQTSLARRVRVLRPSYGVKPGLYECRPQSARATVVCRWRIRIAMFSKTLYFKE
jgi:hypothetical protein